MAAVRDFARTKDGLKLRYEIRGQGDPVALMGSTGRSTGPHVHFEVIRNGRPVDPLSFIGRK